MAVPHSPDRGRRLGKETWWLQVRKGSRVGQRRPWGTRPDAYVGGGSFGVICFYTERNRRRRGTAMASHAGCQAKKKPTFPLFAARSGGCELCPAASPLAEARMPGASRAGARDHELSSGHWLALRCLHLCCDRRRMKTKPPNLQCSPDLGRRHPSPPSLRRWGGAPRSPTSREGRNTRAKCSVLGNALAQEQKPTQYPQ